MEGKLYLLRWVFANKFYIGRMHPEEFGCDTFVFFQTLIENKILI